MVLVVAGLSHCSVAEKESLLPCGHSHRPRLQGETPNFIIGEIVSFVVVHPSSLVVLWDVMMCQRGSAQCVCAGVVLW